MRRAGAPRDAPHIYDGIHLPGHYYNCFLYGGEASTEPEAGQTGFVPGSHFCEACYSPSRTRRGTSLPASRPRLASGDALIFDARILHFGLPNRSSTRRAIVYCNHTEYWFRDPKNWDDRASVFDDPTRLVFVCLLDGVFGGELALTVGIEHATSATGPPPRLRAPTTFTPSTRHVCLKSGVVVNTSHIALGLTRDAFAFGTARLSSRCKTDRKCTSD